MPLSFAIYPARNLAYFTMRGAVNVQDCADLFVRYVNNPLFDPKLVMLTDARDLHRVDASFIRIVMAVEKLMPHFSLFRQDAPSVIYTQNETVFGMGRMLQQVVEPVSRFRFVITDDESTALRLSGQPETCLDDLCAELEAELRTG